MPQIILRSKKMQNKNKNFNLTYEELKKIFEEFLIKKSQAQENQNRL